jgi:uncharacterized protein (TIGR00725 family)
MKKLITVFGPGSVSDDSSLYREAELLGSLLGSAGFNIVNGGYSGVMEAVSKGARSTGAAVIAVTAEVYAARGREPNQFVSREVKVKSAVDRLMELIDLSDACIALGISPGTLLEVITVWEYMLKGFLGKRPVILIGNDWQGLGEYFDAQPCMTHHRESISYTKDSQTALALLEKHFGKQPILPELDIIRS